MSLSVTVCRVDTPGIDVADRPRAAGATESCVAVSRPHPPWTTRRDLSTADASIGRQSLQARGTGAPEPQGVDARLWLEVASFLRPRRRDWAREAQDRESAPETGRTRTRWRSVGIPELRGARFGAKAIAVMLALAYYESLPGHGVYVGTRRLAEHAGCTTRYARLVRSLLRASGLLIRTTHGAGTNGARDLLAFPGGERGASAFITRRSRELQRQRDEHTATGARPTGPLTISDEARRVMDEHPRLVQKIADTLGGPDDSPGALRALTVVLDRAKSSQRRVIRPEAYVRTALRRDRAYFRSLMVDPAYHDGNDSGPAAVQRRITDLAHQLAPPG